MARIQKQLTPTYLLLRRVSPRMRHRIYAPYSANKIRLKWLNTTNVSLLRRRILGAYLRWLLGALPLIYALNM